MNSGEPATRTSPEAAVLDVVITSRLTQPVSGSFPTWFSPERDLKGWSKHLFSESHILGAERGEASPAVRFCSRVLTPRDAVRTWDSSPPSPVN